MAALMALNGGQESYHQLASIGAGKYAHQEGGR